MIYFLSFYLVGFWSTFLVFLQDENRPSIPVLLLFSAGWTVVLPVYILLYGFAKAMSED